jgi:hypothetical protein
VTVLLRLKGDFLLRDGTRKDFCLGGITLARLVVKNPKPNRAESMIDLITDWKESPFRTATRYPARAA